MNAPGVAIPEPEAPFRGDLANVPSRWGDREFSSRKALFRALAAEFKVATRAVHNRFYKHRGNVEAVVAEFQRLAELQALAAAAPPKQPRLIEESPRQPPLLVRQISDAPGLEREISELRRDLGSELAAMRDIIGIELSALRQEIDRLRMMREDGLREQYPLKIIARFVSELMKRGQG